MSEIIIRIFQIIHIDHHKCRMFQLLRMLAEQLLTFSLESTSVVKSGQCIIISLIFNAHTLSGNFRHIFHKTDTPVYLFVDLHSDITDVSVIILHTIYFCVIAARCIRTFTFKIFHDLHKTVRIKNFVRITFHSKHGKEIICHINALGIGTDLKSAKLHTGHFHNAQEFRRYCYHILVQLRDSTCKLIQLPDSRIGKLQRCTVIFLCFFNFRRELPHRPCQTETDDQAAENTHHYSH